MSQKCSIKCPVVYMSTVLYCTINVLPISVQYVNLIALLNVIMLMYILWRKSSVHKFFYFDFYSDLALYRRNSFIHVYLSNSRLWLLTSHWSSEIEPYCNLFGCCNILYKSLLSHEEVYCCVLLYLSMALSRQRFPPKVSRQNWISFSRSIGT